MKLRITIEREREPDEKGYKGWDEVYQQIVNEGNVEVEELVSIINRPRANRPNDILKGMKGLEL